MMRTALRDGVCEAYAAAARDPGGAHPFPVGRDFAQSLGYPEALLASLPVEAVAAFTGVSNVSVAAPLREGWTVLDVGCGAGLDALVAAGRVGSAGRVVGVDFGPEMLARAREAARRAGARNVHFVRAAAERLPLADGSVDGALVNGIFNLNPARDAIFRELARVVAPDGLVYAAELILTEGAPVASGSDPSDWFA